jgi:hypothetical protein
MYYKRYTAGLGQKAKELPPEHRCYTVAEVELIISRLSLDIRAKVTHHGASPVASRFND